MDGVQLCARFSLATNRLDFCGPAGAHETLYRAVTTSRDLVQARRDLAQFEALMPYLETIGQKHGLDPFDYRVVEAYWIGNALLDSFTPRDFGDLLDRLVRRGLPRSLAQRLRDHLPARPLPHHAFHVSFVGVGNVTGHVETTLANMESCRPGFGTVASVVGSTITMTAPALELHQGRLRLSSPKTETTAFDLRLLGEVGPGDPVASHWHTPAVRLEPHQFAALARYTQLSLEAASEGWAKLGTTAFPP